MLAIRLEKLLKEQEEQIKNRDESLEKAREEIRWLRKMLKEQEAIPSCHDRLLYRRWLSAITKCCPKTRSVFSLPWGSTLLNVSCYLFTLAQVSFSEQLRLNTRCSGVLSRSVQK